MEAAGPAATRKRSATMRAPAEGPLHGAHRTKFTVPDSDNETESDNIEAAEDNNVIGRGNTITTEEENVMDRVPYSQAQANGFEKKKKYKKLMFSPRVNFVHHGA